ncbi:MAG: hypothetical protein RIQ41_401 [Candidatus Parcubacteria bacterium]|jgi:hypothetical protein
MTLFDDTQHEDDPLLEEQIEQYHVGKEEDRDAIRDTLLRKYETKESAIEDYRKGYLTHHQLEIRFTQEEVEYIVSTAERRNEEDTHMPSGFL